MVNSRYYQQDDASRNFGAPFPLQFTILVNQIIQPDDFLINTVVWVLLFHSVIKNTRLEYETLNQLCPLI